MKPLKNRTIWINIALMLAGFAAGIILIIKGNHEVACLMLMITCIVALKQSTEINLENLRLMKIILRHGINPWEEDE